MEQLKNKNGQICFVITNFQEDCRFNDYPPLSQSIQNLHEKATRNNYITSEAMFNDWLDNDYADGKVGVYKNVLDTFVQDYTVYASHLE